MADQIKAGIEGVWNRGYRYKCYELKVVVDITVGASFDDIPFDRIGVRIDPSPGNVRGWVSDANPAHNPPSEDPTDRVIPDNDRDDPTTWGLSGGATAWAHEFGHILGLNDSYITERLPNGDVRSVPLDPANPDMMTHHEIGALNRASVNRLIKRNMHQLHDKVGKAVTDDDLNCDYKVDVASGANYYKGTKCNGPKGAWVINIYAAGGQGSAIGSLNWTIPKNAMTAAVTGSWSANLPPVTSTWDVTSFVTFVDAEPDSNAPPKLDMKTLTGTWTTTAPGGINNVQDFTAPAAIIDLQSGNFCRGQSQPPG
jgi:hypothetical protein